MCSPVPMNVMGLLVAATLQDSSQISDSRGEVHMYSSLVNTLTH